jgi:hypothetical protein
MQRRGGRYEPPFVTLAWQVICLPTDILKPHRPWAALTVATEISMCKANLPFCTSANPGHPHVNHLLTY